MSYFDNLPDVSLFSIPPSLREGPNATPTQPGFVDMDPTTVLGAGVRRQDGLVGGSSVLKQGVKIEVAPTKDVIMSNFIENQLKIEGGWLSFIQGQLNYNTRAEVSIVKSLTASVNRDQVDKDKWQKMLAKTPLPSYYGTIFVAKNVFNSG